MNRGAIHDKTRRLINERSANVFSDSEVNEAINFVAYQGEARIRLVAPHEFLSRARANTTAGTARYPRGTFENVYSYRLLDQVGPPAGEYKDMTPLTLEQITGDWSGTRRSGSSREKYGYALDGTEIVISPAPSFTTAAVGPLMVGAGLEVCFWEPLPLSSDADVPRMPVALHHRLAYGAAVHLLADSKDVAAELWSDIARKWEELFGETDDALHNLRQHYRQRQPVAFRPGVAWAT